MASSDQKVRVFIISTFKDMHAERAWVSRNPTRRAPPLEVVRRGNLSAPNHEKDRVIPEVLKLAGFRAVPTTQ